MFTERDSEKNNSGQLGNPEESIQSDPMLVDDISRCGRKRARRQRKEAHAQSLAGDQTPAQEPTLSRPSPVGGFIMAVLSGNILSRKEVKRVYPYLLFIAFLAFLYITNVFRMQSLYRQREVLNKEVRELRAKSMTLASQCAEQTRQSNIVSEIRRRELPLQESLTPNKVITKK